MQGPEEGKPEVACQSDRGGQITTGGGFSHTFPLPSWQADAVSGYLKAQTQRTEITEKTGITTRTSQQQKQKQEDDDSDSSDIDSSSGGCSGSGSGSGEGYPWQAPYSGYPINRRGYPDISALANRYIVAANGMFFQGAELVSFVSKFTVSYHF